MVDKKAVDLSLLRKFAPLGDLRPENLAALSKKAALQTIPAGRPLFVQGGTDKKTYYLVRGDVELRAGTAVVNRLRSDAPEAKHPIAPSNPRRFSAYAITVVEALVFDSDLLDVLLTWDETGIYTVDELTPNAQTDPGDWMTTLLQTKAFHAIPPTSLQAIFMRLQRVPYRAGEVVMKQGDEGDYFYTIAAGRCAVTRDHPLNVAGVKLGELGPGDSFGEIALICDVKRTATVTMLTDGALMRLNKSDFNSLLVEPKLQRISYPEAAERVANGGAKWLDMRLPAEFKSAHLAGAVNLPLHMLRLNLSQLDTSARYVVVCDTERGSAAGTFVLNTRGYDAVVLQGGMPPAGLAGGN